MIHSRGARVCHWPALSSLLSLAGVVVVDIVEYSIARNLSKIKFAQLEHSGAALGFLPPVCHLPSADAQSQQPGLSLVQSFPSLESIPSLVSAGSAFENVNRT